MGDDMDLGEWRSLLTSYLITRHPTCNKIEDVVQEMLVEIWQADMVMDVALAKTRAHQMVMRLRDEGNIGWYIEEENDVASIIADAEVCTLVQEVVDKMKPHQQEIFRMRYVDSMSLQEIADTLEITRQAVHGRLVYIIDILTEEVGR